MHAKTIRIVHRDSTIRRIWRQALAQLPAHISDSQQISAAPNRDREILIIGDSGTGTMGALDLIARSGRDLWLAVIVVAGHDSCEELAIRALKLGVNDYLREPVTAEDLAAAVDAWLPRQLAQDCDCDPLAELVGESEQMRRVREQIRRAARVDSTVLVTGESGTGKELAARTLHRLSARAGNLVTLNCAAIPDTLLESELFGHERGAFTGAYRSESGNLEMAQGGTLFLDEIGELSAAGQAKLLRAIELKEVRRLGSRKPIKIDARVVAATNRRLDELVAQGRFREDLYYRLNVVQIHMVPLRERMCDLPLLISHSLCELNNRFKQNVKSIDEPVERMLTCYRWPGNVREFRNVLEATFVSMPGPTIRFEHLPEHYQRSMTALDEAPAASMERHRLIEALKATRWNKSRAAAQLRWSRVTLYRKLAKYGLFKPTE